VISDQLFLFFLGERVQRVEGASEVSLKGLASFDYSVHDFDSLFVGNAWSEWITFEVATNTNASRDDHSLFIFGKGRAVELWSIHVWSVVGGWWVFVVGVNNLIEELVENFVRAVRAGVASNSRVNILCSWNDAGLKGHATVVLFIFVLFPNFFGGEFAGEWLLVVCGPNWEVSKLFCTLEPGTTWCLSWDGSRFHDLRCVWVFRWCAAHWLFKKV